MKVLALVLVLALLVGGAIAIPALAGTFSPHQPAAPVLSIGGPTPATQIACFPSPCDCTGGNC
ncbi:MAG: hypothetical protein M1570_03195 [Chloroflexi bacterium]|nr:hypothetical protein [Chloroflexota bacterium]